MKVVLNLTVQKQCLIRHYEVCVQHCTKKITDELTLKYTREIRELKEQVVSLQDKMATLAETLAGVNGSSAGSKSDFSQDFIKEVCKATIRQE